MQGQIIGKVNYGTMARGTHEQTMDVSSCAPGTYIVRLMVGKKAFSKKLIVTR